MSARSRDDAARQIVRRADRIAFLYDVIDAPMLAVPYRFFADTEASGRHEKALREAVRHEVTLVGGAR